MPDELERAAPAATPADAQAPRKRSGRPPKYTVPPTELGRWLAARGMTSAEFVMLAREKADLAGVDPDLVPTARSLTDLCAARYAPSAPVMLVIRVATDGEIDLQHWVRDIHHDRKPIGG